MSVINRKALQTLNRSEATMHVTAVLPNGDRITVRVIGVGSKVCGRRMDNGRYIEDIEIDWLTSVSLT